VPIFRTTYNILKDPSQGDIFDENWMNFNTIQTPPKTNWDYAREMQIEDVDIWEVISEASRGIGVYAAWSPYAEFYMVTNGLEDIVTFYGAGAQKNLKKYLNEKNIRYQENKIWVDKEEMWLYE
jgi:hypothetical protein